MLNIQQGEKHEKIDNLHRRIVPFKRAIAMQGSLQLIPTSSVWASIGPGIAPYRYE